MKLLLIIGSGLSFLAIAGLPSGYYTFLRIYLTIIAAIVAYLKYEENKSVNIVVILFGVTAIVFNPIIPVYLYDESIWAVIDILVGLLFIFTSFTYKTVRSEDY